MLVELVAHLPSRSSIAHVAMSRFRHVAVHHMAALHVVCAFAVRVAHAGATVGGRIRHGRLVLTHRLIVGHHFAVVHRGTA